MGGRGGRGSGERNIGGASSSHVPNDKDGGGVIKHTLSCQPSREVDVTPPVVGRERVSLLRRLRVGSSGVRWVSWASWWWSSTSCGVVERKGVPLGSLVKLLVPRDGSETFLGLRFRSSVVVVMLVCNVVIGDRSLRSTLPGSGALLRLHLVRCGVACSSASTTEDDEKEDCTEDDEDESEEEEEDPSYEGSSNCCCSHGLPRKPVSTRVPARSLQ